MENMKAIDNMSEVLDDEIKKIAKKGDNISPQELDNAYKAMKTIYYGEVIKAMKKAEDEREQEMKGYSQNRGYSYGTMREPYFHTYDQSMDNYSRDDGQSRARAGRDGDGDGRYSEGSYDNSYRRGRDAMGRFTSRDGGYSGHEDKEQLRQQLQQMQQKLNQMQ